MASLSHLELDGPEKLDVYVRVERKGQAQCSLGPEFGKPPPTLLVERLIPRPLLLLIQCFYS